MRVLVTGATGHLGTNLVYLLCAQGREVRAFVRPTSPRQLLAGLPIEWAVGDLLDSASIRQALDGVSVVYHAAAVYRTWAPDPETVIRPTLQGTRNLLQALERSRVERLIYVSTIGTIGFTTDPSRPRDENAHNTHSRGAYFRAKILAEESVVEWHRRTGLPVVIVNPGSIIGPRFLRPTPTTRLVLDFLNGKARAIFQTGFNLVDAEDVARGALAAEAKGIPGRRYLLGGENLTMEAIYRLLSSLTGIPVPRLRVPPWVLPPVALLAEVWGRATGREPLVNRDTVHDLAGRYAYADSSRAIRELGYRYLPAEEALRRTIEWALEAGFIAEPRRERLRQRLAEEET
ncbi:MAG: hypothetical protein KatS3mg115_1462 [Candidatus Poribacteria bacterium]|nr:MAG: hypothetical protein KatS3mg115_1462 [Candidatus Poribacteria bacterium]